MLFILQDHVLTGLRRTGWVPVGNAVSSVAKIALLPAAGLQRRLGHLRRLGAAGAAGGRPGHRGRAAAAVPAATAPDQPIPMGRLIRFAATDHVAALLWMATANVLTLMVLQQLGPEASAYYYMANTIAYALFLVTSNISSALVAEGARFPDRAPALVRAALRNAIAAGAPGRRAGRAARRAGARPVRSGLRRQRPLLLQLLLLSAVPQLVIGVALAAARLRQDLRTSCSPTPASPRSPTAGPGSPRRVGADRRGHRLPGQPDRDRGLLLVTGRSGLRAPRTPRRGASRRALGRRLGPALASLRTCPAPPRTRLLTSDSDALVVAVDPPAGRRC